MTLVEIDQLTVKYPGRKLPTLQGTTLALQEGETVLLLGTSGCGKSTLALTLNGLIPHSLGSITSGSVCVEGLDTQSENVATLAQRVGIVFQDPEAQFVTLTVEDELVFGLENLCLPIEEMDARIDQALISVGLAGYRQRRVDQLSGGEKQRVALASLLAMQPSILVFDEPTANLDPLGTQEIFALLRQQKAHGTQTIILIEHKLDDLMDLIDRVVVLGQAGSILADGPPRVVFSEKGLVLEEYGIWMPQVCHLALRLRSRGIHLDPFPITLEEASHALQDQHLSQHYLEVLPSQTAMLEDKHTVPALEVRNLTARYGKREVLSDISFMVPKGCFLAIVGANGAGKTTLAQHLIGILRPPANKVFVHGKDLTKISAKELLHHIGYVFQNPEHQFITDSVAGEIEYGLRVMGLSKDKIASRTEEMLARFGLTRFAPANPFTLSHGEKRRLSVASMLAVGQEILILDEPTFGQDQRNATALLELLQSLHHEGRTIVVVTHDMTLVAQYAQYVLVLNEGRVLFNGTPGQLFVQSHILAEARLTPPPMMKLAKLLHYSPTQANAPATVEHFLAATHF